LIVEQGERGAATPFSIYEYRKFEDMQEETVRHYRSDLLREVTFRLGMKEVRSMWPEGIDLSSASYPAGK
jgi:hypothetical protein